MNYYNEIDPYAAQWLRNLIAEGLIPDGHVDERSIEEVKVDDLRGYTQHHFFAGIGGWPLALRLAGWPDTEPCWSGSCPCQPFSVAGKRKGFGDERHLWPVWFKLIKQYRPTVIFGEQVSAAGKWPGDLQGLRDREAIERVLRTFEGGLVPSTLQALLQSADGFREIEAGGQRTGGQDTRSLSAEEPGAHSLQLGEGEIGAERHFLRAGPACGGIAIDSGYRNVSDDRHSVQSGRRQDVGQSVIGSDRLQQGLRAEQRPDSLVLRERDAKSLGAEQDHRDCRSDQAAEDIGVGSASGGSGDDAEKESNWLRLVRGDLETLGFAVGAIPIEAASAGADHLRDRYWFVADAAGERWRERRPEHEVRGGRNAVASNGGTGGLADRDTAAIWDEPRRCGGSERSGQAIYGDNSAAGVALGDAYDARSQGRSLPSESADQRTARSAGMANADVAGEGEWREQRGRQFGWSGGDPEARTLGDGASERRDWCESTPWPDRRSGPEDAGFEWVIGADGKARRVKSGICLLADGVPARVGKLRAFGNAIDPRPAAQFIGAYRDIRFPRIA